MFKNKTTKPKTKQNSAAYIHIQCRLEIEHIIDNMNKNIYCGNIKTYIIPPCSALSSQDGRRLLQSWDSLKKGWRASQSRCSSSHRTVMINKYNLKSQYAPRELFEWTTDIEVLSWDYHEVKVIGSCELSDSRVLGTKLRFTARSVCVFSHRVVSPAHILSWYRNVCYITATIVNKEQTLSLRRFSL